MAEEKNHTFQSLIEQARAARTKAYAPYSEFKVGTALKLESGDVVTGCNIECVDFFGLEALEAALSKMVVTQNWRLNRQKATVKQAVFAVETLDTIEFTHYPSPKALGRLRFFASDPMHIVFTDSAGNIEECQLSELLPRSPNIHQSMLRFANQPFPDYKAPILESCENKDEECDPELLARLKEAMTHSIAPSSGYSVAAVIESAAGRFYNGCNIETALHNALHAEECAIANMVSEEGDGAQIKNIYVLSTGRTAGWPCGNCRQKIAEFTEKDAVFHAVLSNASVKSASIGELLPHSFRPEDIQDHRG